MIVQRSLHLRRLLAAIGLPLLTLLVYDVCVTLLYMVAGWTRISQDNLPLPLLGSAVALVVTLRNNAAYARWWEGRVLWGQIVNESRNFVRGLIAMTADVPLQILLTRHQVAYTQALRLHLLRLTPWPGLARLLHPDTVTRVRGASNVPLAVQTDIADRLGIARRAGDRRFDRHGGDQRQPVGTGRRAGRPGAHQEHTAAAPVQPVSRRSSCGCSACCCRSAWCAIWSGSRRSVRPSSA